MVAAGIVDGPKSYRALLTWMNKILAPQSSAYRCTSLICSALLLLSETRLYYTKFLRLTYQKPLQASRSGQNMKLATERLPFEIWLHVPYPSGTARCILGSGIPNRKSDGERTFVLPY